VGKTNFAGDDRFTVNVGMGMRLMPMDWLAVHADVRDHIFDIDLLGQGKTAHNLEAHVGVTFFF
jgi:outer membrane beta-barrel protein